MITSISEFRKIYENVEERIEVSCAALASIVIDGKYLLIKEKQDEPYQPIGGALEYKDSALMFLNSIGFQTKRKDNDLRITILKSKLDEFKTWFESGADREITIDRELVEELGEFIDSSILSQMNTNDYILKEVITDKFRIFQIHDITMSDDIKSAFIQLIDSNPMFKLFTKDEIENNRHEISTHSIYVTQYNDKFR